MRIVTHDGPFHCDDVFSAVILRQVCGKNIRRTRAQHQIQNADIVFDVGGVYNPEQYKFDHHFKARPKRLTGESYSSFGLIWKQFGCEYVAKITKMDEEIHRDKIELIWVEIDDSIVKSIDMYDNAEGPTPNNFTLAESIESINPAWDDEESQNAKFWVAVNIAEIILNEKILTHNAILRAKTVIENSSIIEDEILCLDTSCPWQRWVNTMETMKNIKFVIFPHSQNGYRIQTVPITLNSKAPKQPFPQEWGGLSGNALEELSGISGLTFCHRHLYIAGADNKDAAVNAAKAALA